MIWLRWPGKLKGPVLVAFHSARAVSLSKLQQSKSSWTQRCAIWTTHSVSCSVVLNMTNDVTWSVRFLPTLGLSTKVLIFRACSSLWSPIPEFNKICGVPKIPPATITSFLATICSLGLFTSTANSTPLKRDSLPTGSTRVTCVLSQTCKLFPAGSMYVVAALLLSLLWSMENWFHAMIV